jgi:hypothetical protein
MDAAESPLAPAPWTLRGSAFVTALRFPPGTGVLDDPRFLPASLHGRRRPSGLGYLMYVDYERSDVGPYRELLFIPGTFRFADGGHHFSINAIYVSSQASVVNGRRNWGLPKQQADFEVADDGRERRVRVAADGRALAELTYVRGRLPAPPLLGLVPAGLRTIAQHADGQTYIFAPACRSAIKLGRLVLAWVDADRFPDVTRGRALVTAFLPDFRLDFPAARILPRI